MRKYLILFAKQPLPGHTKTRLAGVLGLQGAADLYQCLLLDALTVMHQVQGVVPVVAYTPESDVGFFKEVAPHCLLLPQQGNDLGERMDLALRHFFDQGADQVTLVGSDIPLLTAAMIEQAFAKLDAGAEVVFGPAEDGGYYLIGMTHPQPALLRSVPMSTPRVLYDTLVLATANKLQLALLPAQYDIDTPADLTRLSVDLAVLPDVAIETRTFLEALVFD